MNAYEYALSNRERHLDELKDLLRLKSISALSIHNEEMVRTASWLAEHLRHVGMTRAEVIPTAGHPIVYSEWMGAERAPTVLVYGHYDVQPVDDDGAPEKWRTPPFEPTLQDGNLYARGSSDDKGQLFAHIKMVESYLRTAESLPVNLKILLEGEEEISSVNLHGFIENHQDLLRPDVVVISDGQILATDRPAISYGLRGLLYTEIEVKGPRTDLHSGSYGGVVHNPAQALCEIIAGLHFKDGRVDVPGFYDSVRALDAKERNALASVPWTTEEFVHETGVPVPWGEEGYTLRERVGARPTLEVNGLVSGFTGEGPKTVLPSAALAKVSCRLVADQDPLVIYELLKARVSALTPNTVRSEVRILSHGFPSIIDLDSPMVDAAARAYQRGFGASPVFMRDGGSIPVVATFQRMFRVPVLMVGFGLPDDHLHAPNEKLKLDHFYRGINTAIALMEEIAAVGRRE